VIIVIIGGVFINLQQPWKALKRRSNLTANKATKSATKAPRKSNKKQEVVDIVSVSDDPVVAYVENNYIPKPIPKPTAKKTTKPATKAPRKSNKKKEVVDVVSVGSNTPSSTSSVRFLGTNRVSVGSNTPSVEFIGTSNGKTKTNEIIEIVSSASESKRDVRSPSVNTLNQTIKSRTRSNISKIPNPKRKAVNSRSDKLKQRKESNTAPSKRGARKQRGTAKRLNTTTDSISDFSALPETTPLLPSPSPSDNSISNKSSSTTSSTKKDSHIIILNDKNKYTVKDLKKIAKDLGIEKKIKSKDNKATIVDRIIENTTTQQRETIIGNAREFRASVGRENVRIRRSPRKPSRGHMKGGSLMTAVEKALKENKIDLNTNIDSMVKYVKFGKKLINQQRLFYENILQVAYPSLATCNNSGFKTQSVSPEFSFVLRQMLKHNNPSYDDLDKLTDDEKNKLHDLCCYCKSLHHFSIPAPSKTKYEKLINEYRTIVGELASGNNNDELVKRLKQLLILS
jgi:hypothetical protein